MNRNLNIFVATAATLVLGASGAQAQQASLTLRNGAVVPCYSRTHEWTITKTRTLANPIDTAGPVEWQIVVAKDPNGVQPKTLSIDGVITISNTGSAPAPIGNIVINLQRQVTVGKKTNWVSYAADVNTQYSGNAATSANIVASASAEVANLPIYVVSGAKGTFTETSKSGDIQFTDVSDNSVFSLADAPAIPVGGTVTLKYVAGFNPSGLNPGDLIRTEALVSFSNSGPRGGSGSSATNIDVTGDGSEDGYVRTVPLRITSTMPALEECNDSVNLADAGLAFSGTVTATDFATDANGVITEGGTYYATAIADGGTDGGTVTNTATLTSEDEYVTASYTNPDLTVTSFQFLCCKGIDLSASSTYEVVVDGVPPPGFHDGEYFTYTKGKYNLNAGNPVATFLTDNWASISPLTIGVDAEYLAKWTDVVKLRTYVTSAAGGASGPLTADVLNPTSTAGGNLPRQLATLKLTLAINDLMGHTGLGALKFKGGLASPFSGGSLDGMTIADVVALADKAVSKSDATVNYSALNNLINEINRSFDDGIVSAWAISYLTQ